MTSELDEVLAAAFRATGNSVAQASEAPVQDWSSLGMRFDSSEEAAQTRLDRQLINLLARGVIQFTPDAPQNPNEASGGLGSPPILSQLDAARVQARAAAAAFEKAGDVCTAAAIREAIRPKRPRGRTPEWQASDVLFLWTDVMDIARSNKRLKGRSIFAVLAKKPDWREHSSEALRSKFREGVARIGITQDQAIAALRELGD